MTRIEPTDSAAVAAAIREAAASKTGVRIVGGGSKQECAGPIDASLTLSTAALAGIIDHDPTEQVITAHAGTPLGVIEAAVAAHDQMLAFEPFDHGPLFGRPAGAATIGGIVAAAVAGPRRLASGGARDHLLGFEAVSGRGEAFKAGGRVVKNVTGYDLSKLVTGSWGTLVVLTSVTLRLLPRPRTEATLRLGPVGPAAAGAAMTRARASSAGISAAAYLPGEQAAVLRLDGFGPSVDARFDMLAGLLAEHGPVERLDEPSSRALWASIRDVAPFMPAAGPLWRVIVPPAQGWQAGQALDAAGARCLWDWAGGLIWAAWPDEPAADETAPAIARRFGGHATRVRRAAISPASVAGSPAIAALSARVKALFDPAGILNPAPARPEQP